MPTEPTFNWYNDQVSFYMGYLLVTYALIQDWRDLND